MAMFKNGHLSPQSSAVRLCGIFELGFLQLSSCVCDTLLFLLEHSVSVHFPVDALVRGGGFGVGVFCTCVRVDRR